jgi:hypothetical protein
VSAATEWAVLVIVWRLIFQLLNSYSSCKKGKAVPLQAWSDPEGSRKLRLPDFVTTAQDGGRLSALRTGRLCPQEILLELLSVRGLPHLVMKNQPRATVVKNEPSEVFSVVTGTGICQEA